MEIITGPEAETQEEVCSGCHLPIGSPTSSDSLPDYTPNLNIDDKNEPEKDIFYFSTDSDSDFDYDLRQMTREMEIRRKQLENFNTQDLAEKIRRRFFDS